MQATLPSRIANSAYELTCATLAGPATLEEGLAASSNAKPQIALNRRAVEQEPYLPRIRSSRPQSSSHGQTFRTAIDPRSTHDTERELDSFLDYSNLDASLVPTAPSDGTRLQESSWYQEGSCAFQEGFLLSSSYAKTEDSIDQENPDVTATTSHNDTALKDQGVPITDSSSRHSTAARRLTLIDAHLQQDVSLRHSAVVAHEPALMQNARQVDLPTSPALWDTQRIDGRNTDAAQHVSGLPHHASAPQTGDEDRQLPSRVFHCPYIDCHRRLRQLNSFGSEMDMDHRPCVHVGCTYQSETAVSWVEHVAMPHHDLQGLNMEAQWAKHVDVGTESSTCTI